MHKQIVLGTSVVWLIALVLCSGFAGAATIILDVEPDNPTTEDTITVFVGSWFDAACQSIADVSTFINGNNISLQVFIQQQPVCGEIVGPVLEGNTFDLGLLPEGDYNLDAGIFIAPVDGSYGLYGGDSTSFEVAAVPEPGLGFVGLLFFLRRRC